METLQSKILVYDDRCPMCSWYTQKMVNNGMLDKNNRVAFTELNKTACKLDINRARHEIPLYNSATGNVVYGLDALTEIFSATYPTLQPLITRPWFKALVKPLYLLISYNRRLIAGSENKPAGTNAFAPDFNFKYRSIYVACGFLYTALCVYLFALLASLNAALLLACVTGYFLWLHAFTLIYIKDYRQRYDYMGQLATLGFIEGTLFLLAAWLGFATGLPGLTFAGQGAGRLLAIQLHRQRTKNNGLPAQLNFAFASGAITMVIVIAYMMAASATTTIVP